MQFQKWHEVNSRERCKVWENLLWWVSKAYVSTRKFHRNCIMTQICDDKFKGKLTRGLKNDIRNLVSFHADSRMSWKFALWRAPFVQTIKSFRWKSTEELCLMTLKSDAKFEEKLALGSKNDMRNLVNFNASSGKSENLYFDVLLLSKVYYFWAKKVKCHNTEGRCKIWGGTDLCFEKWHEEFGEFLLNTWKSQNLHFKGLFGQSV